jgi:exopolyphosphatase/guanosine-5'-triphosphate,3'-diphosphate pyrophosphatase
MRLGVLDVGSNTVHLLVVDAHPGAAPLPAASVKTPLRLSELLHDDGSLGPEGAGKLQDAISEARREAEALGAEDLLAFATSAVRDATNAAEVLADVRHNTGVDLQVLAGEEEARLTFLAVRRWFGWSAGRLLALDIGGGSLEVACGQDEDPDVAASLPLGASRLTREWLPGDPPKRSAVQALRKYAKAQLAGLVPRLYELGDPDRVVATSKTLRSLARIAGAAPYSKGPYVRRILSASDVEASVGKLAKMSNEQRVSLPGVSADRAGQLLAGAVVAAEAMDLLGVPELDICPWALREGVILRRLDHLMPG